MAKKMSGAAVGEFDALKWRCIGPPRGGRVVAVSGDPVDRMTFYFGACAGGIWKTTDGGVFWRCVSDGYMGSSAVGSIAVAPSDANVIYAGMGETTIRLDVSYGAREFTGDHHVERSAGREFTTRQWQAADRDIVGPGRRTPLHG